jgi:hypothetical protein
VPSLAEPNLALLQPRGSAERGFAESTAWSRCAHDAAGQEFKFVALLTEYPARLAYSAGLAQLNLSPFIPPADSHSSTIFWNSMGPPPYSPPTNPGPLSS